MKISPLALCPAAFSALILSLSGCGGGGADAVADEPAPKPAMILAAASAGSASPAVESIKVIASDGEGIDGIPNQ